MLSKAISLAAKQFEGVSDKSEQPYILHCLAVMNQLDPTDHELMSIGVLHDVVEDTAVTLKDLYDMGFSHRVVEGVDGMTKRNSEEYDDFIRRCAMNEDSKIVKRADLNHNMQVSRLKGLRQRDFARLEKYCKAYEYLKD